MGKIFGISDLPVSTINKTISGSDVTLPSAGINLKEIPTTQIYSTPSVHSLTNERYRRKIQTIETKHILKSWLTRILNKRIT